MKVARHVFPASLVLVLVSLYAPAALAATCGTFLDTVTLSATSLSFGAYLPASGVATTANGTVTAACTFSFDTLPSFTATLSTGSASSYIPRHLSAGTAHLDYNLYTSSAYTIIWGTGSGGSSAETYSGGLQQSHTSFTAYGRIPASQLVSPGNYSDNITVTITY